MTGAQAATMPSPTPAEAAVARMREMSAELRGCAILDRRGRALAASGDADRWGRAGAALLDAADAAGDRPADQVHVATEDGEVFAVRHRSLGIVAVAERFVLSSLMLFDMRAVLRDLVRELAPSAVPAPGTRPR